MPKQIKQLSTPAVVAITLAGTILGLGLIGLLVFRSAGSGGEARTKLGNELVGTIRAVDDLTAELEGVSGCSGDPRAILAKYQEINNRFFAVLAETLEASQSGAPSEDLTADINQYSPLLQTKAEKLATVISQFSARCGGG